MAAASSVSSEPAGHCPALPPILRQVSSARTRGPRTCRRRLHGFLTTRPQPCGVIRFHVSLHEVGPDSGGRTGSTLSRGGAKCVREEQVR